jgi:hypothetical protein
MTLKIEKCPENQATIFRLSGRMRFDGLLELKRRLDGVTAKPVLDLKEVTHVDLEVVHFLSCCVQEGIELRNCARYIREWILREQGRQTDGEEKEKRPTMSKPSGAKVVKGRLCHAESNCGYPGFPREHSK